MGQKKRSVSETEPTSEPEPEVKNKKKFNGKEFRQELRNDRTRLTVLREFVKLCGKKEENEDCTRDYLESGGSCLELVQLLEEGTNVPQVLVLEAANYVLLTIVANQHQHRLNANESCKYFLNSHISMINKMLGLSSSAKERVAILKLLTTIVMFSYSAAKDILLHLNFHSANLQVLTKHVGSGAVRNAFLHFLVSFLVNGHYPVVALFLTKRGLLTSIINGLRFDTADSVCLILNTIKNYLLENPFVSKTVKMKTFNTLVVKDIVNLYNWKGPAGFNVHKQETRIVDVDEVEKSRVSEAVHGFLLVLCTSHKFGVIFNDRSIGLSKKNQNGLMYTVLESLERPWEHSYAAELVSKICGACPDLVKTMWGNLKQSLEPRSTAQWVNAVKFARTLLQEVQPSCIEFCVKDLTVQQFAQSVQVLVAPTLIIKTLLPETDQYPTNSVKHEIFVLIEKMLQSLQSYTKAATRWFDADFNETYKNLIRDHLGRNFPQAKSLLEDWATVDNETQPGFPDYTPSDHLGVILSIFEHYYKICPEHLDSLLANLQFSNLFEEIQEQEVQIQLVKVFTTIEPSLFLPSSEIFPVVIPIMLQNYHDSKNESVKSTLQGLLKNTGIFEGCESEINLWLNAVHNVKVWDSSLGEFFVSILKQAGDNSIKYLNELSNLQDNEVDVVGTNVDEIIESLMVEQNYAEYARNTIKHMYFSSLLLASLDFLKDNGTSKSIKQYMSFVMLNMFHYQTNRGLFNSLVRRFGDVVPKSVASYVRSWDGELQAVGRVNGRLNVFELVSTAILQGDISLVGPDDFNIYPDLKLDLLQMTIFYLTNFSGINSQTYSTCLELAKLFLRRDNFSQILTQPLLLQKFSPLHVAKKNQQSFCTLFVLEIVEFLQERLTLTDYLNPYRAKLYSQIMKLIQKKKTKSVEHLVKTIEVFSFNHLQCREILSLISKVEGSELINEAEVTVVYHICNYTLRTYTEICIERNETPLEGEILTNVGNHLCYLNELNADTSILASNLATYLQKFPHAHKNLSPTLFKSILLRQENCKENTQLLVLMLRHMQELLQVLEENIEAAVNKKGLILPVLDCLIDSQASSALKQKIYNCFEPSILKALQKPQKSRQQFEKYPSGVSALLAEFMPESSAQVYLNKIQKFDSTETFHVNMLSSLFSKFATTEKTVNISILTFIHLVINLFKHKMKANDSCDNLRDVVITFNDLLKTSKLENVSLEQVRTNEAYKLFCKFCLKFGIGKEVNTLEVLITVLGLVGFPSEESEEFMEMVTSHSEFVNTILGEENQAKRVLLELFFVICEKFGGVMQKLHIPLLLGGYSATLSSCDQITLKILKLYESVPEQTSFYDFKPLLWGTAASNHYSLRLDVQKALWRQPKVGDVLDSLQESWVLSTIVHQPLNTNFDTVSLNIPSETVYDLRFILPLFSQLLAPENNVPSYRFTKSGALSLTVSALSSENKEIRMAACHILARFHHHLEGRHSGKDNMLWLSYVEAVCRGTAVIEDFKLNNFASLFLARMALILSNPQDVMYVPLSQYLGAKSTPNVTSIPELYTFLHSTDVAYKEHRLFILEVIRDGVRTNNDFDVFSKAMAHKLFMELFTSVVSDQETKYLILDVIKSATSLKSGVTSFCNHYGLLSWLQDIISTSEDVQILKRVLLILQNVIFVKSEDLGFAELLLRNIISGKLSKGMKSEVILILLKCIFCFCQVKKKFLTEDMLRLLIDFVGDKQCEYMLNFKYVTRIDKGDDVEFYIKTLTQTWLSNCN